MADETTTVTLSDIINSEWINPVFQDYASAWINAMRFSWEVSIEAQSTQKWQQPRFVSAMGDVGSENLDPFDATEAVDLQNTVLQTTNSSITVAEYGILRTLTDDTLEDTVSGTGLIQQVVGDAARILMTAFEDDTVGQYGNFTNVSGTSGLPITLDIFSDAIAAIRNRGVRFPGGLVFVGSDTQARELEESAEATGTSQAVYPGTADGMLRVQPDSNNGGSDGRVMQIKGVDVYQSSLVDDANGGVDKTGAMYVRGDRNVNQPFAAIGTAVKRRFRSALERDESLRATEVVGSMRMGTGVLQDVAGQAITTQA